ncbi:MAG: hypothetical protein N2510_06605 [Ignavibacteria bacterium]|nr:hypothetical protein [Ignavibacteria bacterium]
MAFIVAAEQRDMTKVWNTLGPEAQAYYNSEGEKLRKSGKGILESEIATISKFRSVKKDYLIKKDSVNPEIVNIVTIGGPVHKVLTENYDGNYKIKDHHSVRELLKGISAETIRNRSY